MKKVLTIIVVFLIALASQAQNLDTVNVNLTLRAKDWAWFAGKYGAGQDSVTRAKVRALRDAVRTANPQTWDATVTVNNVPGHMVIFLYHSFATAPFGEVWEMGSNQAERIYIATQIKAVNNSVLQYYVGVVDAQVAANYTGNRQRGKEILLDN